MATRAVAHGDGEAEDLFAYLNFQGQHGTVESSGVFTVAREKALEKFAMFHLADPGDWIVKVVQAIVASNSRHPISVNQDRRETMVRFTTGRRWDPEELRQTYEEPDADCPADLHYLRCALWTLIRGQGRAVSLTPMSVGARLVHNGQGMRCIKAGENEEHMMLLVGHATNAERDKKFWNLPAVAARANAAVLRALCRRCYASPVSIRVDGLDIDALQNHSRQKTGSGSSLPLYVGVLSADLPLLTLSPGTWRWKRPPDGNPAGSGLEPPDKPIDPAGLGFLVSYHHTGSVQEWSRPSQARSSCHWVLDGAIIERDVFDLPASSCTLDAWISAHGLTTDLGGFALNDEPERRRRRELGLRTLAQATRDLRLPLQDAPSGGSKLGNLLMGVGGLTFLAAPLAFPMAGALVGAGWLLALHRKFRLQEHLNAIEAGLKDLSDSLVAHQ